MESRLPFKIFSTLLKSFLNHSKIKKTNHCKFFLKNNIKPAERQLSVWLKVKNTLFIKGRAGQVKLSGSAWCVVVCSRGKGMKQGAIG